MNRTKVELRQELKNARLNLSETTHKANSRATVERLKLTQKWADFSYIHVFEPLLALGELDISDFIKYLENLKGPKLFTSRQQGKEWSIVGLDGNATKEPDFDAVIVPMLGFDKSLQRIGYGGGYYDRFLSAQPKALKIGVCFEEGKLENLPSEEHDVAMDLIVTEKDVYRPLV